MTRVLNKAMIKERCRRKKIKSLFEKVEQCLEKNETYWSENYVLVPTDKYHADSHSAHMSRFAAESKLGQSYVDWLGLP